jgi:putative two-component system response regulator
MMDSLLEAPILIVDDLETNVRLLRAILERAGHTSVRSTTDSSRVIAMVDEIHPDLILLDLHMPEPDGFAILRQLSERASADAYLPVLVISADITERAKEEALSLGANDFLSKPFNATEAVLRVRNLLHTRLLHVQGRLLNESLEEGVRQRTRELDDARFEILDRLALVSDFRDDSTGKHSRRVGQMAGLLARSLDLPPAEAELYRWAAPLHDIGKIGISDSVLLKPGPLTPAEFEQIKTHATIGARILSGSQFPILQLAEEIALTHHERWDGKGYHGMAGEEIPLSGRIVSVCDVFDALTHERPYKHAWPVDQALAEIASQRGLMFEPRLVDAFLSLPTEAHFLD